MYRKIRLRLDAIDVKFVGWVRRYIDEANESFLNSICLNQKTSSTPLFKIFFRNSLESTRAEKYIR